ncbi:Lipoprotein transmembrane (plasmid) [Cupriavidus sp. H19C3]|uniref:hypothetical protein n=1 Tax=Cupriavidus sp. H19C3 TaxID=3241603 RepID=UPI003BF8EF43
MQNSKVAPSTISAAALLALAACGGGGGDAPATQQPGNTTPPAPTIAVTGSAATVSADPLAVVFVPHTEKATVPAPQSIAHAAFPAQFQKVATQGAYSQVGIDANSLISFASGKIVEVAGNGDYSIGRWTDGSSSLGSVSVNQGDHYVLGKPLALTRTPGPTAKLNCSLLSSTSPTAVSGNFAPGKVTNAAAVIDLNGPLLESFNVSLAIGSDASASATVTSTTISGVAIVNGSLAHVQVMGTDATHPLLAVGFTMPTPSSGDVNGIVVLKCQ